MPKVVRQIELEKELEEAKNNWFPPRDPRKYPERRADKLEAGHIYRTRNGLRAKIYSIEPDEIHGAISSKDGKRWEPEQWDISGSYLRGNTKEHHKDIIVGDTVSYEEGKKYRSRNGSKILLCYINKNRPDFPMVGFIQEADGALVPRIWNEKGWSKAPYGPTNDIVAPWEEA